jgi:1-phosphofructokinase
MTARVMVFAPSPQLTITLEHDTDGAEFHLHAGGQGVWQARMIHALGVDVTICCALGGETGRVLRTLIAAEGATLAAVDVTASNGVYLHDRRGGGRVEIARAPGRPLSRHEQDDLYGMAIGDGLTASLCLMSGVASPDIVPPSVYRRLAGDLRRNGVSVMADLSGEFLTAALDGGLDLVKVSDEELLADRLVSDTGVPAILAALAELQYGADTAVISRGDQPAIARCRDEPIVEIVMPQLEPVDHAGAGDSMSAAIAATLARGADVLTALQVGAAAGALNVTRRGLGTGDPDVIQSLAEMVRVRRRPDAGETPSA